METVIVHKGTSCRVEANLEGGHVVRWCLVTPAETRIYQHVTDALEEADSYDQENRLQVGSKHANVD